LAEQNRSDGVGPSVDSRERGDGFTKYRSRAQQDVSGGVPARRKGASQKGDFNALAAESWRIAGEFGVTATCPSAAAVTFSTGSDSRA
jgi:hypothetical protein